MSKDFMVADQRMVLIVDATGLGCGGGGGVVFVYYWLLRGMWQWLFEENDAGSCGKYLPLEKNRVLLYDGLFCFPSNMKTLTEAYTVRSIFNSGDMTI